MRIKKLTLENFRGFSELKLQFNGKNVVLVGTNGAGKSTILNAAVILLSRVAESLSKRVSKKITLSETDIKNEKDSLTLKMTIQFAGLEGDVEITKARAHDEKRKPKLIVHDTTNEIIRHFHQGLDKNEGVNLPVFISYPVHRNVFDIPLKINPKLKFDQFSAYHNSFLSSVDFKSFFEWYRRQEEIENEKNISESGLELKYEDPKLKAVRNAIYHFLPGFSNLKIMRKGKMKMVITKGSQRLEVSQLSNGEKCTLAMIGDLARRLSLANPGLENPLEGAGIVLIDEIELHLHPAGQRDIVNQLQTTFPNIQFIISTHSPQVLGEIQSAQIFFVTESKNGDDIRVKKVQSLFGKDSNLILEEFMGAAEKNEEIKEQQLKLYRLLMESRLSEAKKLMDHLTGILGSDDPSLVKAGLILKRKESLRS
jgi:predicted ATP-binding protein involved in virulence